VFPARAVEAVLSGKEEPEATGALRGVSLTNLVAQPRGGGSKKAEFASGNGDDQRHRVQRAMTTGAGVVRSAESLRQAIAELESVHAASGEAANLVVVARALCRAALAREESRGAHQRTDFPRRDDDRFLAHSLAYRSSDDSCRIEYLPVTITRWPPGERVYGR